jgi:hypothetical protein
MKSKKYLNTYYILFNINFPYTTKFTYIYASVSQSIKSIIYLLIIIPNAHIKRTYVSDTLTEMFSDIWKIEPAPSMKWPYLMKYTNQYQKADEIDHSNNLNNNFKKYH